jgi:N-sulfoglucosamine sulfohydrolase
MPSNERFPIQTLNRRTMLKSIATGAAALAVGSPTLLQGASGKKPRNVVLYVVDDQGTNDAGCYGNPVIQTPGLDALAREGTRFTNAFCTSASCSASRSVILTGRQNHATGQFGHSHAYHHFVSFDTVQSLPNMLNDAGYRTAIGGKFHVAPEALYHFQQRIHAAQREPEALSEAARGLIASDDPRPFFLHLATVEPHRPFHRDGSDPIDPKDVVVPPYLPDTPECREELAQYYMSVQRADKGLVRLIEILKETGHWDDTLILYLSDNGIAFPGAKTTLYEPGMRLPMVVRNPLQESQGAVCDALVNYTSITPTILDYAGVEPKDVDFHGPSFLGILDEEHPEGWDEIFASHTFHEVTMYYPMRVVRGRRFKLIWNIAHGLEYPFASDLWDSSTWQGVLRRGDTHFGKRTVEAYLHRPEFELFDLDSDPDEVRNLADDPRYATVLAEQKAKIKAFQERTDDPWILKWEQE